MSPTKDIEASTGRKDGARAGRRGEARAGRTVGSRTSRRGGSRIGRRDGSPAALRAGPVPLRIGPLSLRLDRRAVLVALALLLCAGAVTVCALGTGRYALSPGEVLATLSGNGPPGADFIVRGLRLPRAVDGLLVGAAMGAAGALFQSLTRNPLGSPDITGFGSGASAGALVAIMLFDAGPAQTVTGALAGGLATAAAVYLLAWRRGVHGYRLILIGIGASAVLNALTSFLYVRAEIGTAAQAATWMAGSLSGRGWGDVRIVAVGLALLLPVVVAGTRRLTLLEMGDDLASGLGVPPERSRLVLLAAGTGLTAVAVAAAGPVPFVALAAPQLVRRLTRSPGPNVLPAACMGTALVAAADWAAQLLPTPSPLPVGALTTLGGGVYLCYLLFRERRAGRL